MSANVTSRAAWVLLVALLATPAIGMEFYDRIGAHSWVPGAAPGLDGPATVRHVNGAGLTPPWLCEYSSDCDPDYLAFPTLALEHADPRSVDELDAAFAAPRPAQAPYVPSAELAVIVREALGTGFLFDSVEEVPLDVVWLGAVDHGDVIEEKWLLHDPWVGAFPASLFLPAGTSPFAEATHPAVLFLTGHLDAASDLLSTYDGRTLLNAGYAVLGLQTRSDDAGPVESWVAQNLLIHGFTLMGLRAYEAMQALRALRSLPGIDPARLGVLGHSGGGSLTNLLVRLEPTVAAAVFDHHSDFRNVAEGRWVLCETVFDLIPHAQQLSDPSDAPVPTKRVDYGWENGAEPIVRFLDRHLK